MCTLLTQQVSFSFTAATSETAGQHTLHERVRSSAQEGPGLRPLCFNTERSLIFCSKTSRRTVSRVVSRMWGVWGKPAFTCITYIEVKTHREGSGGITRNWLQLWWRREWAKEACILSVLLVFYQSAHSWAIGTAALPATRTEHRTTPEAARHRDSVMDKPGPYISCSRRHHSPEACVTRNKLVARRREHCLLYQKVSVLIPGQGTYLGFGFHPWSQLMQ